MLEQGWKSFSLGDKGSVFVLSGEDITFPFSEIKALIQTYAPKETCESWGKRVVYSSLSDPALISKITSRAAYCRFGGHFISRTERREADLDSLAGDLEPNFIEGGKTFAVASKTIEEYRELGAAIKQTLNGAKVSLEKPDIIFQVEKTDSGYVMAFTTGGYKEFSWRERRPRARKFFLPSAIYPKLARLLVNLCRTREGEVFSDPFCGTGSLLIEAAIMGMKCVGVDRGRWVAKGALKNLKGFNLESDSLVVRGDSTFRNLSLSHLDGVATDVPYGRAASTRGKDTKTIIREFCSSLSELLVNDKGRTPKYAVIMRPSHVDMELERKSFQVEEEHLLYVHRKLTRAINVLRRL